MNMLQRAAPQAGQKCMHRLQKTTANTCDCPVPTHGTSPLVFCLKRVPVMQLPTSANQKLLFEMTKTYFPSASFAQKMARLLTHLCSLLARCIFHAAASVSRPPQPPCNFGSDSRWALAVGRTGGSGMKLLEKTASAFRGLVTVPTDKDVRRPRSFGADMRLPLPQRMPHAVVSPRSKANAPFVACLGCTCVKCER
mmetsp:Transcript_130383/g.260098  ORF Transcript_130383/g.260098 Transcript_130383/m.260098 type:complete len:196 (+) Transcript_130383:91-678(+)